MPSIHLFARKAEKYARYRWDYAPEAIQAIFDLAGLGAASVVADVGAGTGILTCHFAGRVRQVAAVEPDPGMRIFLRQALATMPGCQAVAGCAEYLPLAGNCVDMVTVAQAIHWFSPEPARQEFARILKPGGWLALISNHTVEEDPSFSEAMQAIHTSEYGVIQKPKPPGWELKPAEFFFSDRDSQRLTFPFSYYQDWEHFLGAANSASFTPEEDSTFYPAYVQALRAVFERFSVGERLAVNGETELVIGHAWRGGV